MRPTRLFPVAAAVLALSGCALLLDRDHPQRSGHTVSLVNSLSWDNPMSGKRDGLRSAWPLATLDKSTEHFPLAQVKQCDSAGVCSWGVLSARRTIANIDYRPGGVALELDLLFDVARTQKMQRAGETGAMTIPADVGALSAKRALKQVLVLEYGKVHHIDLDFGVGFDLCVARLDQARAAVDKCDIAFH